MKVAVNKPLPVYPAPAFLVGVYDEEGKPGGMIAAWGGVCCSEPPCISVAVQKARYSFGGIVARKAFTVNVPSEAQAAEADYFGIFSGRDGDKFAACGLTRVVSAHVRAPSIAECPVNIECRAYTKVAPPHTLLTPEHRQAPLALQHTIYFGEVLGTYRYTPRTT